MGVFLFLGLWIAKLPGDYLACMQRLFPHLDALDTHPSWPSSSPPHPDTCPPKWGSSLLQKFFFKKGIRIPHLSKTLPLKEQNLQFPNQKSRGEEASTGAAIQHCYQRSGLLPLLCQRCVPMNPHGLLGYGHGWGTPASEAGKGGMGKVGFCTRGSSTWKGNCSQNVTLRPAFCLMALQLTE